MRKASGFCWSLYARRIYVWAGSPAEFSLSLQEQLKQGEKLLQPLVGWEAPELGSLGKRFLALRSQLTEFSRALAQRRQQLADAEKLFQLFKQVAKAEGLFLSLPKLQSLRASCLACMFSSLALSLSS